MDGYIVKNTVQNVTIYIFFIILRPMNLQTNPIKVYIFIFLKYVNSFHKNSF